MNKSIKHILMIELLSVVLLFGAEDHSHYTTVNQLGLTVTNHGVLGEGFKDPAQPSCMYKQYPDNLREQVEHMSHGGLWIGGKVKGEKRVTTAVMDGVFDYETQGFEFKDDGNPVMERSRTISDPNYSPEAVSDQDFITTYHDTAIIENHKPLNIMVEQSSYAWDHTNAEAFVIVNYHITNIGNDTIQNAYVGFWADVAPGNMNHTSIYVPGGGWSWYDNLNGFDESNFDPLPEDPYPGRNRDIAYCYDTDGDDGYTKSYIGFSFLGSDCVPCEHWETYYDQWRWNTHMDYNYPEYYMPITDAERYDKLSTSVPRHLGEYGYNEEGYPSGSASWMLLISAGPFGSVPSNSDSSSWLLPPGGSFNVAMTVVCAPWAHNNLADFPSRRELLYANADWAQRLYNGEDKNWNEKLDAGEDLNSNGRLDRYVFLEYSSTDPIDSHSNESDFQLYASYPNPFNPVTTINYCLNSDAQVELSIFDMRGKYVANLVQSHQSSGFYSIRWDASEFSSGIYFYQLKVDNSINTGKMVLVK